MNDKSVKFCSVYFKANKEEHTIYVLANEKFVCIVCTYIDALIDGFCLILFIKGYDVRSCTKLPDIFGEFIYQSMVAVYMF